MEDSVWANKVFSWVPSQVHFVGDFEISWDNTDGYSTLRVFHQTDPNRELWSTRTGESFVQAKKTSFQAHEGRGSFTIEMDIQSSLTIQTVSYLYSTYDTLFVGGRLFSSDFSSQAYYFLYFEEQEDGHLRFISIVWDDDCDDGFCIENYNQIGLTYSSSADERFLGFGEQFSFLDLKGHVVPILTEEGGIGRGRQPLTFLMNLGGTGSGGTAYTSYASIPHYLTSLNRSLFLESSEYCIFDLSDDDSVRLTVQAPWVVGRILYGSTPLELIERYTQYAGRMKVLPDWLNEGAVVGLQGGTKALYENWRKLQEHDTPVAAFWIQDWSGIRKSIVGSQVWWNWELDEDHYSDWTGLRADLEEADIRIMGYVSSMMVDASLKGTFERNLHDEALDRELVVHKDNGDPYYVQGVFFDALMLDLTNPETRVWFKDILKTELIDRGFSGWMADFSDALPFDSLLHNRQDAATFHNLYTESWAQVNREAIEEAGREGDIIFFNRSGSTRSPRHSTLFWEGDQLVTWDEHDGFKSAIVGLISGGLSGMSLNHSDIGGYTAIDLIFLRLFRERQLFYRWAEANAFTAVYRTHEGNRPKQNHQFYSDDESLRHFARFAKVYRALAPYRRDLMLEAETKGYPLVRHPYLEFPEDPKVLELRYQWMLGSEMMIAPVTNKWDDEVSLYLPAGRWTHLWSGATYEGGNQISVQAPVGEPGVFFKEGSAVGHDLVVQLQAEGIID